MGPKNERAQLKTGISAAPKPVVKTWGGGGCDMIDVSRHGHKKNTAPDHGQENLAGRSRQSMARALKKMAKKNLSPVEGFPKVGLVASPEGVKTWYGTLDTGNSAPENIGDQRSYSLGKMSGEKGAGTRMSAIGSLPDGKSRKRGGRSTKDGKCRVAEEEPSLLKAFGWG